MYIYTYIYLHMMYYIYYIYYIHNIYIYLYIQYIQGRANRGGVGVYQFLNRVAENTKIVQWKEDVYPNNQLRPALFKAILPSYSNIINGTLYT